jgi:hypothetical protein
MVTAELSVCFFSGWLSAARRAQKRKKKDNDVVQRKEKKVDRISLTGEPREMRMGQSLDNIMANSNCPLRGDIR